MKDEILKNLTSKYIDLSKKIRDWEDTCKKIGVDPSTDRAYIAATAYRSAINDMIKDIRSVDEKGLNKI
jgi:hypothetical protein